MVREVDIRWQQFFDTALGCWGCKDENSVFMYANEAYGKLVGVLHPLDVIGRTDFDMPCKTVECAADFQAQDGEVIATNRALKIFDWHPYADGLWQAHIFTKTPMCDSDGTVIGTIFHGEDISTLPDFLSLGPLLDCIGKASKHGMPVGQTSYLVGTASGDLPLSPRTREVLFFLLRGWSAKMMARVLNISHRTIEIYVDTLKNDFGVQSRAALIDAALGLGYFNRIPESLFNRQLSVVLSTFEA